MKLVVIESPFAGDVPRNIAYAKAAVRDCLARNESPYASHLFFPGILDDTNPGERALGIEAGFAWGAKAGLCAVYADYGISDGMRAGIARAGALGIPIEWRSINATSSLPNSAIPSAE